MTNAAWSSGIEDLMLAFPERAHTEAQLAARMAVYRRYLDVLTDEEWRFAVEQAIVHGRWFPTIAELRDHAASWREPVRAYTPEELEAVREQRRVGLEALRLKREQEDEP